MFPRVLRAYGRLGYWIDLGCPARVFAMVVDQKGRRTLSCSGGMTVSDAFLFASIARVVSPRSIFVIGNSFGLSTFVLAELFPDAVIDAIDAEAEGLDVGIGSRVTHELSRAEFTNVRLTKGYSPQDLGSAMRERAYELVFVDGMHTNEQLVLDVEGMLPRLAPRCVVVLHDVASMAMFDGLARVSEVTRAHGFAIHRLGYTQMGCCVLVRGCPEAEEYFAAAAREFEGPYLTGFSAVQGEVRGPRPWFWDLTFGHLEKLVRRKVRRIGDSVRTLAGS